MQIFPAHLSKLRFKFSHGFNVTGYRAGFQLHICCLHALNEVGQFFIFIWWR